NLQNFVDQGFLVPLDDYLGDVAPADLYERAPKQVWDAARLRGPDGREHLYAIPISYAVKALKIRHDVLAQMGFDHTKWPRTWDELYALAQDVCAKGERRGFGL